MPGVIGFRRGSSSALAGVTPVGGELLFDEDDLSLRVGDGTQAGGWVLGGRIVTSVTGTSHTTGAADQGHLLITSNAAPVAVSLPTPSVANNFANGQGLWILCDGVGAVTITPSGALINGGATLGLTTGQLAVITSDGTNYYAGVLAAGGSGTVTSVASGNGLTGGPITTTGSLSVKTTHLTKTTNYTVTTTDNGVDFDNIGAGGAVIFTLPTAAAGLGPYGFLVDAAQTVEILCSGTDKITDGVTNSASGGNIQSASAFSFLRIQAHKTGQWIVTSYIGSWTVT